MQIGMIGLGRMGANMVRRLMRDGHRVRRLRRQRRRRLGTRRRRARRAPTRSPTSSPSLSRRARRGSWFPRGYVQDTVDELAGLMESGDAIIDGGNSYYRDDVDRSKALEPKGIDYLDVGTSGGVWGLERGYCLMIGGPDRAVERLDPIFATIAPGIDGAPERTPGRSGEASASENGYLHCGPVGRGPLREDGPQRDRVRRHGRLRGGPEHHQARQCRQVCGRGRCRDDARCATRSTTSTTSI